MPVQEDIVIELLKGFPDNVAAFACHGHLTKAEYETVVIPDIEERLKRHKKVRLYTLIDRAEAPERSVDHATGNPLLPGSGPR